MAVKRRPHAKCKRCGHSYQSHGLAEKWRAQYRIMGLPTSCAWCPDCPEYIGHVKLWGYGQAAKPRRR